MFPYRDLGYNHFNPSAIPTWLGDLTKLKYLCVRVTIVVVLVGRVHAATLAINISLYVYERGLEQCHLQGTLPEFLSKLNRLTTL